MEKLTLESKEFKRVMQNLRLENMSLSEKGQKKSFGACKYKYYYHSNIYKGFT